MARETNKPPPRHSNPDPNPDPNPNPDPDPDPNPNPNPNPDPNPNPNPNPSPNPDPNPNPNPNHLLQAHALFEEARQDGALPGASALALLLEVLCGRGYGPQGLDVLHAMAEAPMPR